MWLSWLSSQEPRFEPVVLMGARGEGEQLSKVSGGEVGWRRTVGGGGGESKVNKSKQDKKRPRQQGQQEQGESERA